MPTSTAQGEADASYGWINRDLIASGKLQPPINVIPPFFPSSGLT